MGAYLQILFSKEHRCWMPSLWCLQGDYSLNLCLQLTGKLDFFSLSQGIGMEKPCEICAFDFFLPEYLEMSWKNWGSSSCTVSFSCYFFESYT